MFCPLCGTELSEAGDCPSCGQARPNIDALPKPAVTAPAHDPSYSIGCAVISIFVGIGIGILICVGFAYSVLHEFEFSPMRK